ncbi:hypothetical protein [Sphingobium chungbukense]|uniref:Uncharacterized protein n=1 Tax=Sphingobium chungbukense TaxID=56193 RepID=A0A0M3AQM1_9SPHN|nr:hypothetical protein [Sphingobium chungbukense]KKW92507.1 hypothetical protein YP76_06010 [Sphingobium chungbukense]
MNRRFDGRGVAISMSVWNQWGAEVARFADADLQATPAEGRWIYQHHFDDGVYRVRVEIDGHLAYEAMIPLQPALF